MGVKERKNWRLRRPRLGRGWITGINLALAGLLLTVFWGLAGYPLPPGELEYHRLERQNLLSRRELVLGLSGIIEDAQGEAVAELLGSSLYVGAADGKINAIQTRDRETWSAVIPMEEGPTPVPFVYGIVAWVKAGEMGMGTPLVLLQVPREAAAAELEVEARQYDGTEGTLTCTGPGWDMGDGVWLFVMDYDGQVYSSDWLLGRPYSLRLYRADGSLLLEQRGLIPRGI